MKSAIFASLVASAAAFAPSKLGGEHMQWLFEDLISFSR
jgi:hypothetical protein